MKCVITLVHGNRPKANGRLSPGSFLRRQLEERLAGPPKGGHYEGPAEGGHYEDVTFREFAWTGTNSHTARIEAGHYLALFIRDGHALHPDAQHVIVAHSHGGNVALYAMRDPDAREIVSGIVTLGTPFIQTKRRDLRGYAEVLAWLFLLFAAVVPLMVFDTLGLRRAAVATLVTAPFVIVLMKARLARWLTDIAIREQDDIVAALQPPSVERARLAIFCARGDEASRWLRIWKVVTEMPVAVGSVLLFIVAGIARFNLPGIFDGFARYTFHSSVELRVFGLDERTLWSGVIALTLIWVAMLMVTSVVRKPGHWQEPLLANVLVEIGTSAVPSPVAGDCHTAHFFDVARQTTRSRIARRELRHSAICDDRAVVAAIAHWIDKDGGP